MNEAIEQIEAIESIDIDTKKYYIESYGCQMNLSDSEVVASILSEDGYINTDDYYQADLILLNTCSIRDKAEQRIRNRLRQFNKIKKENKSLIIGILGCMAERVKKDLLIQEKLVDLVAGPDVYRDLPKMISTVEDGIKSVNVLLSREETYADISPVRYSSNGVTAFVSIMRGCDNMCSFCIVPFTRGRERSRPVESILCEVRELVELGYKEVTLLGQNVDSYRYSDNPKLVGNKLIENKYNDNVVNFSKLLEMVAQVNPNLRVRFSTSHPKDMTDDVYEVMSRYNNICKAIHLPIQSGSDDCLDRMNRSYTIEVYMDRVNAINKYLPNCAISTDIITGFCGETDAEHQMTLDILSKMKYDMAFMYYYSERPGTLASKRYEDNVELEVKKKRLAEIVELQNNISLEKNKIEIGSEQIILIEYTARKSSEQLIGRNDGFKKVIIPKLDYKIGDYVKVKINGCTSASLFGEPIELIENL